MRGWKRSWWAGQRREVTELLGSCWQCLRAGAPMGAVAQCAGVLHELFSVYLFF